MKGFVLLVVALFCVALGGAYAQDYNGVSTLGGVSREKLKPFSKDKGPDRKVPVDRAKQTNVVNGVPITFESRHNSQDKDWRPLRDDLLWHAEAANVSYLHAGNVSLLSASRFGLSERLEISTFVAEDVLRPSIYLKFLWRIWDKRWFLSSRFNVANAYTGMLIAQRRGFTRIISPDVRIPLAFELGHEMLFSRAWFSDPNCSDGSVYFILTAGLGLYGGSNVSHIIDTVPDLSQVRYHFMANRGETVTGSGFRGRLKLWADGRITPRFMLHGGLAYHFGTFERPHAVELQAEAEYFFFGIRQSSADRPRRFMLSAKGGLLLDVANYQGIKKHVGCWPIIDISFYFGRTHHKSASLFGKDLYRRSKF